MGSTENSDVKFEISQKRRNVRDLEETMFAISQRARESIRNQVASSLVDEGSTDELSAPELAYYQKQLAVREEDLRRERQKISELESLVKNLRTQNRQLSNPSLQVPSEVRKQEPQTANSRFSREDSEEDEEETGEEGKNARKQHFVQETKKILARVQVPKLLLQRERSISAVSAASEDYDSTRGEDMFDMLRAFEKETGVETFIFSKPPETKRVEQSSQSLQAQQPVKLHEEKKTAVSIPGTPEPRLPKSDSFKAELEAFLAFEREVSEDFSREESMNDIPEEEKLVEGFETVLDLDTACEFWDKYASDHRLSSAEVPNLLNSIKRNGVMSKAAMLEAEKQLTSHPDFLSRGIIQFEQFLSVFTSVGSKGLDELKWRFDTFPQVKGRIPVILFQSALEDVGCTSATLAKANALVDAKRENFVYFSEYVAVAQLPEFRKFRLEPYQRFRASHVSEQPVTDLLSVDKSRLTSKQDTKGRSGSTHAVEMALAGKYSADKLASKIVIKKKVDEPGPPSPASSRGPRVANVGKPPARSSQRSNPRSPMASRGGRQQPATLTRNKI